MIMVLRSKGNASWASIVLNIKDSSVSPIFLAGTPLPTTKSTKRSPTVWPSSGDTCFASATTPHVPTIPLIRIWSTEVRVTQPRPVPCLFSLDGQLQASVQAAFSLRAKHAKSPIVPHAPSARLVPTLICLVRLVFVTPTSSLSLRPSIRRH